MNKTLTLCLVVWTSALAGAATLSAEEPSPATSPRWLPDTCLPLLDLAAARGESGGDESPETWWNRHYRAGWVAVEAGDVETAERSFCQALDVARFFGPRDFRFAETLDELGLVNYIRGDDSRAEAMQGAATAEILLALGPPADDLTQEQTDLCSSSVATYLTRLGWIFDRQGRSGQIEPLRKTPYLILAGGYIPPKALATRLDWLISRYLLAEDMAAADWLTELQQRLRQER